MARLPIRRSRKLAGRFRKDSGFDASMAWTGIEKRISPWLAESANVRIGDLDRSAEAATRYGDMRPILPKVVRFVRSTRLSGSCCVKHCRSNLPPTDRRGGAPGRR